MYFLSKVDKPRAKIRMPCWVLPPCRLLPLECTRMLRPNPAASTLLPGTAPRSLPLTQEAVGLRHLSLSPWAGAASRPFQHTQAAAGLSRQRGSRVASASPDHRLLVCSMRSERDGSLGAGPGLVPGLPGGLSVQRHLKQRRSGCPVAGPLPAPLVDSPVRPSPSCLPPLAIQRQELCFCPGQQCVYLCINVQVFYFVSPICEFIKAKAHS